MSGNHHDHGHTHAHEHHHSHEHEHHHGPGHAHSHAVVDNLKLALALNLGFAILEFFGGWWTGSVAISSDAVHDFGDALSLGLALFMEHLATRKSNERYSYGYRRWSLLSALITSIFLIVASGFVLTETIPRLFNPVTPKLDGMLGFAILGIAVNGYAAWRTQRGQTMNERVVTWHLIEDLLGWVAVLIGTLVMMVADLPIIDPILSLVFTVVILRGVIKNVSATLRLFLQATPSEINLTKLRYEILAIDGVRGLHDLHLWSLDGAAHVLTMHLVVGSEQDAQRHEAIKTNVRSVTEGHGRIHTTIEIETEGTAQCGVNCENLC